VEGSPARQVEPSEVPRVAGGGPTPRELIERAEIGVAEVTATAKAAARVSRPLYSPCLGLSPNP
jgi:hypothetical protein